MCVIHSMSLERLREELQNDPTNKGYSDKSNSEILDILYTPTTTKYKIISSAELLAWAGANERLLNLEDASVNHQSRAIKNVAKIAVEMLKRDSTELDLNKSDRVNMTNALIAGGVLSQDDVDDLYALAAYQISRAEEIGLARNLMEGDVAWARNF